MLPFDDATRRLWSTRSTIKAIAALRRPVDLDPRHANARPRSGRRLFDSGNIAGALAEARQAIALDLLAARKSGRQLKTS